MYHILHGIVIALENGEPIDNSSDSNSVVLGGIVLFGAFVAIVAWFADIGDRRAKRKYGDKYVDPSDLFKRR